MSLKVVGAGFGRTGTLSLKAALEQLDFEPCYHMVEIFSHLDHASVWHAAAGGEMPDWRTFLDGYQAAVDWPACYFWRELADAFPEAKVILTTRAPEIWYKSISQTIFPVIADPSKFTDSVRGAQPRMAHRIVVEGTFGGNLDKDHVIDVYRAHVETVKAALPKERLLVYDVAQGWEPLCAFLGVAVPDAAFPRTNSTQEFLARVGTRNND